MEIRSNYNSQIVCNNLGPLDPPDPNQVHIFNEFKRLLSELKAALANSSDKEGALQAARDLQMFMENHAKEIEGYIKEHCPYIPSSAFAQADFMVKKGVENYLDGFDSPGNRKTLLLNMDKLLEFLNQVK